MNRERTLNYPIKKKTFDVITNKKYLSDIRKRNIFYNSNGFNILNNKNILHFNIKIKTISSILIL